MTDAPADAPTGDAPDPTPSPKETDWESEAKKWEKRSKDNFDKAKLNENAAQRLAEIEEASKTDLEKLQARAEAAEKRAAEYETREQVAAWKREAAEKTGVPADLLSGATADEISAHAEKLKPYLDASNRGPRVPSPGGIPDNPITDDAAFARAVFGGGGR